jgi:hypothetical protein
MTRRSFARVVSLYAAAAPAILTTTLLLWLSSSPVLAQSTPGYAPSGFPDQGWIFPPLVCDWNGSTGTDNSPILQNAVAAARARNGGVIVIPRGCNAAIANTVSVRSPNIQFVSPGGGGSVIHNAGTQTEQCSGTFVWTGSKGGSMFGWLTAASSRSSQTLSGGGMQGICLDGRNLAGQGIEIESLRNGDFEDIFLQNFTANAINLDVVNYSTALLTDPCDSQHNYFRNIFINQISAIGVGLRLGSYGDNTRQCNASLNTFVDLAIWNYKGVGILDYGGDNNRFYNTIASTAAGGTGNAIEWAINTTEGSGSGLPIAATSESFYGLTSSVTVADGNTGALCYSTTNPAACGIVIYELDKGNGSPDPVMGTGAQVSWQTSTGNFGGAWGGVQAVIAQSYADIVTGRSYLGMYTSALIYNSASDHLRLADPLRNSWGINIDGTNGNLRISKVSGSGSGVELPGIVANGVAIGFSNGLIGSTGGLAAGQILVGQSSAAPAPETVTGDCTLGSSGAIRCTKTSGTAFGALAMQNTPMLARYTIAALPACNSGEEGVLAYVTNGASSPAYNAVVGATGSTVVPVFCNGTNWTYH